MSVRSDAITGRANPAAIMAVVLVSYFMILLNNSIIFTALPSIESSMGLSATGLAWVQDAYTLAFGGLLLLGVRAGDLLGRRRVFVTGLAVFAVASLLVGIAPTGWWLIGAHALQGVGAIVFGVIESVEHGWTSSATVCSLVVGAVLLAGLVLAERRAREPIMPLRLFASRTRVGAYLARMLYLGAMIGFFYFGTQFLQNVLGFTAFQTGLAFLPMTVVNFAVALAIPRLTARVGQAVPLTVGVISTPAGHGMAGSTRRIQHLPHRAGFADDPDRCGPGTRVRAVDVGRDRRHRCPRRRRRFRPGQHLPSTRHGARLSVLVAASAHAGQGFTTPAAALAAQVAAALTTATVLLVVCVLVVATVTLPAERRSRTATPQTPEPLHS
ncbi:MAG TPA: MFS transporter [Aldersonia sp.]